MVPSLKANKERRATKGNGIGYIIVKESSTLLNASLATNFTYNVLGSKMTQQQVEEFNETRLFKDKLSYLDNLSVYLEFSSVQNSNFEYNLKMIDSSLPVILSIIVEEYYRGKVKNIKELTQVLSEKNPLGIANDTYQFYSFKIKEFLTNIALGMMPASVWDGRYDATGGYIIVKEDGDILCYHVYNRNEFREYLFNNTRLETPSTTRHDFGKIIIDSNSGSSSINLNLQIRFIK